MNEHDLLCAAAAIQERRRIDLDLATLIGRSGSKSSVKVFRWPSNSRVEIVSPKFIKSQGGNSTGHHIGLR